MIDTILILLIFYMSFSSFPTAEKRLEARLPLGGPAGTGIVELIIHVRSETEIIVNGTTFDPAAFRTTLTGLSAATENVNLVIEAEADTTFKRSSTSWMPAPKRSSRAWRSGRYHNVALASVHRPPPSHAAGRPG